MAANTPPPLTSQAGASRPPGLPNQSLREPVDRVATNPPQVWQNALQALASPIT